MPTYLFHGYNFESKSDDIFEVIAFLEEQKKDGKIKNYGFEVESIIGRKFDQQKDTYEIILSYFQTIYSPYAIVMSMFSPHHIEKNNQAMQETKISKEQFKSFEKLLIENNII